MVPSLHKKYLSTMVDRVFCRCSDTLIAKLEKAMESGTAVNMEAQFSQLTLDIIGLSVFNYEFNSLKTDSPVIDAVYTALKETESRSTDILPYWQVSFSLPLKYRIYPGSGFFYLQKLLLLVLIPIQWKCCTNHNRGVLVFSRVAF